MLFFISLMIFIWTKRKSSTHIISSGKNQISPHKFANNRLLHLDTNGFSKEFYSELSHITRQFVEKSRYIRALEMTTEEISENENIFDMNDDIFFEWVSLLQKADLIIVLDKGRIAETGTHQTLLNKDGLYAHLCALQSFS